MRRTPFSTRFRWIAIVAAATTVLAACGSTLGSNALELGASTVDKSTFDKILEQLVDAEQIEESNGRIDADAARAVLEALMRGEGVEQLLADYDVAADDAEIAEVVDQLNQDPEFAGLGTELQDLLILLNTQDLALSRIPSPSSDRIAAMYATSPASVGALCLRHLVVEKKETAEAALDDLRDGADFAEVAGRYSIEPNAEQTGGALAGEDNDCLALSTYQEQFDNKFTAGALTAKAGVPTDPVQSSFGWHVIYVRPYDEVADSLSTLLDEAPGALLLTGLLATSKVVVASEYGRWDASLGQIIAN
jgi:parvulin-like peptidyl-prolyl isomerase